MRSLACWDSGFESRRWHGCLSLLGVVCCQVRPRVGPITRSEESYWVLCIWVWSWSLDNEEALAHYCTVLYCTVLWLTFFLTWLKFFLPWLRFFRAFFLSCNAYARVKLAKMGHGPHSSTLVCICVVRLLFVFYVLFACKCVLPPDDNPIAVNKYIISYHGGCCVRGGGGESILDLRVYKVKLSQRLTKQHHRNI
jgi:hypothetical protein